MKALKYAIIICEEQPINLAPVSIAVFSSYVKVKDNLSHFWH